MRTVANQRDLTCTGYASWCQSVRFVVCAGLGALLVGCAQMPSASSSPPKAPAASTARSVPTANAAPASRSTTAAPNSAEPAPPARPSEETGTLQSAAPPVGSDDSAGRQEAGLASWYGPGFHGKRTASGERFDANALTAAHKTLPFGTRVRVKSLVNGKEVVVRINDRGPFIPGRIIDLSRAAALALGLTGVKRVELQQLR
jgi:rare lipoprotein A